MYADVNPLAVIARYQTSAPVDLDAIARDLSIPVSYVDLGNSISGKITRDAATSPRSGFVIQINSSQHHNRQRFTLAHEISHYVLHRDLIESGIVDDTMYRSEISSHLETQANRMASDILMPRDLLRKRYEIHTSVEILAKEFGVSKAAMDIKLNSIRPLVGQGSLF